MEKLNELCRRDGLKVKKIGMEKNSFHCEFEDNSFLKYKNGKTTLSVTKLEEYEILFPHIDKLILTYDFIELCDIFPENIKKIKIVSSIFDFPIEHLSKNLVKLDVCFYYLPKKQFSNLPENLKILRIFSVNINNQNENDFANYDFNNLPNKLQTFEFTGHLDQNQIY